MIKDINFLATSESFMYFSEKKPIGYEFGETWISFWIIFTPVALILKALSSKCNLLYIGLSLIILFLLITMIKIYIKSPLKYLLANLSLILISIAFFFAIVGQILLVSPIILFLLISMKQRRRETVDFHRIDLLIASEIFMTLLYIISLASDFEDIKVLIIFSAINIAIIYLVYIYLSRNLKLTEWEGKSSNSSTKSRNKLTYLCVAFIAGTILALVFITWFLGIFNFLDDITRKVLAFFSSARNIDIHNDTIENTPIDSKLNMDDKLKNLKGYGGENSIISFILKLLEIAAIIMILIIAVYLISKIIQAIIKFYNSLKNKRETKNEEREMLFSFEEIGKEVGDRTKKFINRIENPFNRSNRKKIRKVYYKLIKNYNARGVQTQTSSTPVEIKNDINKVLHKDLKEITDIYEKARYSSQECTKEDVDNLKKYI